MRHSAGSVVGWAPVSGGVLPPAFESLKEAAFDFGGDMAVDLDEAVGEVVAQAFGLGDFGDAVGDEPGLVAVPQPMKGQSGSNGIGGFAVVAVNGWAENAAVEATAP